jgi:hypothetical protein
MKDLPVPTTADIRTMKGSARKVAVSQRKASVAELLDKGRTLRQAAEALGLTFGQVASVSRALIRDSEETYREHRDRINARLLRQNRVFQRECWEHLDRAKLGHIRQELEESLQQTAGQTTPAPSNAVQTKRRTVRENDLMAEARILETLRKAQADEAEILGWSPPPDASSLTVQDNRSIIIVNNADVPSSSPWVASIAAGIARQGIGVMPPGTTDAEIEAVVLQTNARTEATEQADSAEVSPKRLT